MNCRSEAGTKDLAYGIRMLRANRERMAREEGLWRPLAVVPASVLDELPVTAPAHVRLAVMASPPPAVTLTPREREVLAALASDQSLGQIAGHLHVSVNTVKSQVRSLYRRMGVSSRHEAVAEATRLGLVSVRPSESRHPE